MAFPIVPDWVAFVYAPDRVFVIRGGATPGPETRLARGPRFVQLVGHPVGLCLQQFRREAFHLPVHIHYTSQHADPVLVRQTPPQATPVHFLPLPEHAGYAVLTGQPDTYLSEDGLVV